MEQLSRESILAHNSASSLDASVGPENPFSVEIVVQSDIPSADIELPSPERWQTWFQTWLGQLQPDHSPIQSYELSLSLTTDDEIQSLNRQYRQLDKPTNVLAFALLDGDLPPSDVLASLPLELGDIIISVETAQREAQQHGHSLECELAWLASHGLLHLLGWDHPDDPQLKQMLDQQTVLLQAVNFTVSDQFYYAAETY